jgi:hypothetical protein
MPSMAVETSRPVVTDALALSIRSRFRRADESLMDVTPGAEATDSAGDGDGGFAFAFAVDDVAGELSIDRAALSKSRFESQGGSPSVGVDSGHVPRLTKVIESRDDTDKAPARTGIGLGLPQAKEVRWWW